MEHSASHQNSPSTGQNVLQPMVLLGRMPQQVEVRIADDDWTGRSGAAERRKLQNRLHQRTYRKRLKARIADGSSNAQTIRGFYSNPGEFSPSSNLDHNVNTSESDISPHDQRLEGVPRSAEFPKPRSKQALTSCTTGLTRAQVQDVIDRFEASLSHEYMVGSPRADLLLTLVQFNVFRALVGNTLALGFTFDWLSDDAISPFYQADPINYDTSSPENLRSTQLQRTIPHHPWIDLFPDPKFRDNLLRRGEDFDDEDALCHDLVEICHAPSERSGLIVWGDPWDPKNWEVTEDFAGKWAWMLRGCWELLRSTNYWRETRGEEELYFDVSLPESVDD